MSKALVTSTDDFYASLEAQARPLKSVLNKAVATAGESKRFAPPPHGPQLHGGAGSLSILVNKALAPTLLLIDPEFYIGLDGDRPAYSALLMSRPGCPHAIIPFKWSAGTVEVGALTTSRGKYVGATIILGAHDAGERLTAAVVQLAEVFFVSEDALDARSVGRGHRF